MAVLLSRATPETHLVSLDYVFESVMPRTYFIQFLDEKAEEDENIIDCLDIF